MAAGWNSATSLTSAAMRNTLGNGTSTNTRVLWTGHILYGNERSNSVSSLGSVVITPYHTTNGEPNFNNRPAGMARMQSIISLIHELSHQLGLPDHYCNDDKDETKHCSNPNCFECDGIEGVTCIMYERNEVESWTEANIYCSNCLAMINEHLNDHH